MIKKICLFLFFSVSVFAYGIYVNESEFATEIKIDNIKPFISEITKSDNSLIIKLTTSAKLSSIKKFQNKFVDKLEVKHDKMIIKFNDNVDYFYRYDDNNLLLIFAPRKEISDIKLKSIIEKPILKAKSKKIKDADAEKVLAEADEYVNNGLYNNAITKLLDLISTHKNDFYAQEAYYKLGMVYYKLGENDPKNYLKAADYLADFASKFPDHYLASDALYYSALSKEKAGMYYEAIFDYKRVILTYPNTLNAKKSYFKIVNIYENIGQYDKAINALKEYSDKFKDNSVEVLARIGKLYFLLKDIELAKEYFIKIIDKKNDILKLGPDTLYAIAKTFEMKGEIDYAINIYSKIYNIYPESKYADLAMYNTALLMEKKGKDRLADSLLLECKDKYKNRQGGEKATIHYAEKHLKEQPTEYWIDFFSDILSKSSDVNNMAKANRLIIESFYYSKRYDEALASIKEFEAKFFDSLELNRVYDIKQKIYLEYAKRFLKEGNYSLSKSYVDKLLQEFPDSKYRVEAAKISESISLINVRKEFTNIKFEKALSLAQDYLLNHKSIYFKTEWDKLIGDLYYRLYKKALKEGNEVKAVALAKEYMVYYPNGKYKGEFLDYIFNYLMKMTLNYIKNGDYIKVIKLYSDNSGWIKKMNNRSDISVLKGYLAFCYFKLGDYEVSKKIYNEIKVYDNSIVNLLGILFGEKVTEDNVNKLSKNDLMIIFDELNINKKDDLIRILKFYKKDLVLKYDLLLKIIYTLDGDKKYDELKKAYQNLFALGMDSQFPKIYEELGILEFNNKNYQVALNYFKKYLSTAKNKEAIPKVYYYAAKSYLQLDDKKNAVYYFDKLIKEYPKSFYKNLAEKEVKELQWIEKIKKAS